MDEDTSGLERRVQELEQQVAALSAQLEDDAPDAPGRDPASRARRAAQLREVWQGGPQDPAQLVETELERDARRDGPPALS